MTKAGNFPFPLVLAVLSLFTYFFYAVGGKGDLSNIQLYILGNAVFFCVLIAGKVFERTALGKRSAFILDKIIKIGVVPGGAYLLYKAFSTETETWPYYPLGYMRHVIPGLVYLFVMCNSMVIALLFIGRCRVKERRARAAVSIFIIFLQMWFLYTPNFFKDTLGALFHIDAYTNSIINTLNYAPLEQYSCSIYGHYGILYILPVKLLQLIGVNQWEAVTLAIAVIGGCTFALEYWVLSKIIENDVVFILAVVGSAVVSVQIYHGQYYQMLPHRYLFQAVILAGITAALNKGGKIFKAFMWVMAGMAIVWNTETGIVCSLVWMLCSMYMEARSRAKYTVVVICRGLVKFLLAVIGAYGFVNLYNLAVGGNIISFATFLYPLGSESYQVESLQLPLQLPWAGYFFPILILLCILGYYFERVIKLTVNEVQLIVIMAAVLGIGVYTYYMNRAATTNAAIVSFPFIVTLSYIIDRGAEKGELKINKERMALQMSSFICLVIMVSMALSTISTFGATLTEKNQSVYETDSLSQFVNEVREKVPEDAVAFGVGTAQLYAYMDRSTGIYISDWEDLDTFMGDGQTVINSEALEYLNHNLQEGDYMHILVHAEQSQYIPHGYALMERFEYSGYVYELYENVDNMR